MRRSRWAAALWIAVGAAVLAGCTADPPAAAPSSSAAPTPTVAPQPDPPPPGGGCYQLSLAEAAQTTTTAAPVECRGPHTTKTIHVGVLPTRSDGQTIPVERPRSQQKVAEACRLKLAGYLGGDRERRILSRFQVIWFTPTIQQFDLGARWFRCDALAIATPTRALQLPTDQPLRGVLNRPGALTIYGLCSTAKPSSPAAVRVACKRRHSWVAVATVPISGTRYPGAKAVQAAGDARCADLVRSRNGYPLEFTYGWEWPTRAQWRSGQKYGYCWAPNNLA